jgi:prevent-host-death family protein
MQIVSASKFKAHCLAFLDRVDPEGIVITKHGKPVAKLIPVGAEPAALIGSLKDKIRIKGNILSTGLAWDAQSRYPRAPVRAHR